MRKLVSLMLVLLMALMAFGASAQEDEEGTIADLVVASATGDSPEFTTLLTAVQAADPAVLEALSDPEAELTVFAPTDAAFAALIEEVGEEAFAEIVADSDLLTAILLYHVLDGAVYSSDVVEMLEEYEGEFTVPTALGQYLDISADEDGSVYVDDAMIMLDMVDIEASNGVIHVIDAVLVPETDTIAEIVMYAAGMMMDDEEMTDDEEMMDEEMAPEFTVLLTAIQAADPAVLEALSNPEAELTVFAPTDAAFAALSEALGEEAFNAIVADPATLTDILLYHVVEGVVGSYDVLDLLGDSDSVDVTMLNGGTATITVTEDGVFINDAEIVWTDIDAVNGIIHVIDAVIVPSMDE